MAAAVQYMSVRNAIVARETARAARIPGTESRVENAIVSSEHVWATGQWLGARLISLRHVVEFLGAPAARSGYEYDWLNCAQEANGIVILVAPMDAERGIPLAVFGTGARLGAALHEWFCRRPDDRGRALMWVTCEAWDRDTRARIVAAVDERYMVAVCAGALTVVRRIYDKPTREMLVAWRELIVQFGSLDEPLCGSAPTVVEYTTTLWARWAARMRDLLGASTIDAKQDTPLCDVVAEQNAPQCDVLAC